MDYTKEDIKNLKHRGIKPEQIDRQLENFKKGFDYVSLSEPAMEFSVFSRKRKSG